MTRTHDAATMHITLSVDDIPRWQHSRNTVERQPKALMLVRTYSPTGVKRSDTDANRELPCERVGVRQRACRDGCLLSDEDECGLDDGEFTVVGKGRDGAACGRRLASAASIAVACCQVGWLISASSALSRDGTLATVAVPLRRFVQVRTQIGRIMASRVG